jgi:hypothetical protein
MAQEAVNDMVKRDGRAVGGVVAVEAAAELLENVRRQFLRFRRGGGGRKRIPAPLRAVVVAAVERGVTRGALERRCGVSSAQITAWQREVKGSRSQARARVFDVTGTPEAAQACVSGPELALRLGPWSVTVRLESAGAACSR